MKLSLALISLALITACAAEFTDAPVAADENRGKHDPATKGGIRLGLNWLRDHQDEDGRWDADDFAKHDAGEARAAGPGNPIHDVGLTGLALLAFLGDGSTMSSGPHREVVRDAVGWLVTQQGDDGLFGTNASHDYIYDHAIATLAMVEAYGLSAAQDLRPHAQKGIDYLERHRNPHMVWRYQPRGGDNDTSITGWATLACKAAQDFKLQINPETLDLCAAWLEEVTDPATGVCGYTKRGESSSRHPGDHVTRYPPKRGAAMTAVGLMCRFFLGQTPKEHPVMNRAADTILSKPPRWDEEDGSIDHYYWYYGTYALYQMGGDHWKTWAKHMTTAVVQTQRTEGDLAGSWDPVGVWGQDGGRVYSTAMMTLTLEVYYRYARVLVR